MAGPTGEPTRDEVFAFLDARPTLTSADAVNHFKALGRTVDGAKVRKWLQRRRESSVTPVTPSAPDAVTGQKAGQEPQASGSETWGKALGLPATAESRARDPKPKADPLDRLSPAMKADLRTATRGLSAFLATLGDVALEVAVIKANPKGDGGQLRVLDMKQYAHAADTLAALLAIAPGLDAFDTETGGEAKDHGDENRRAAEAMGVTA